MPVAPVRGNARDEQNRGREGKNVMTSHAEHAGHPRDRRITQLAAFTGVVAARQPEEFSRVVEAAYRAGASQEDLLGAVEVARVLADAPGPLVVQAYVAVQSWHRIAARRLPAAGRCPGRAMRCSDV